MGVIVGSDCTSTTAAAGAFVPYTTSRAPSCDGGLTEYPCGAKIFQWYCPSGPALLDIVPIKTLHNTRIDGHGAAHGTATSYLAAKRTANGNVRNGEGLKCVHSVVKR